MTHNPPPPKLSLLPDSAPFTPEQRAWLDGFFIAALGLSDGGITPLSPQEAAAIMAGGAAPAVEEDDGAPWRDLTLENPIRAIREISHDITCRRRVRLANGRELSAIDIQAEYLNRALRFAKRHGLPPLEQKALEMWPQNASLNHVLGFVLYFAGKVSDAIPPIQKVLEINPGFTAALRTLALAQKAAGRPDDAVDALQRALRTHPLDRDAVLQLSLIHIEKEQFEAALQTLMPYLKAMPDDVRRMKLLVRQYMATVSYRLGSYGMQEVRGSNPRSSTSKVKAINSNSRREAAFLFSAYARPYVAWR